MTVITTDTYWEADGVVLNTPAFNIEGPDPTNRLPSKKGSNLSFPYRPGQVFRAKTLDSKQITLNGWVSYKDEDGDIPATRELRWGQFNANDDKLKAILAKRMSPILLSRQVFKADGSLETRTVYVESIGDMPHGYVDNDDWPSATIVYEFLMLLPWWSGPQDTINVPLAGAAPVVKGTTDVTQMNIRLTGPLTNPRLTNTSTNPDVWVQYTGVIAGGAYVDLDTAEFTALTNLGANVIGGVSHSGAYPWMLLMPGAQTLTLTASAGSGSAAITYNPPYV